ncbi:MAG: hypothetical protein IAE79_14190 [Anaerolinea sp.]|nr:hypothetical protein [Anaerolinea sp.]
MDATSLSRSRTLQLSRPFGRSLLLAGLFLILFLSLTELVLRVAPVHFFLGAPALGSEHRQFEQQWKRLEMYHAAYGPVACIMVGDSTVMSNFSPAAFADSYRQQTGEEITCYNFGVGAFTVMGFATLAEILIREYSPQLLIVGVEGLNFTVPRDEQGDTDLSRVPWARYQLGEFTLEGWLYEHTYLYRYLGVLGQLVTFEVDYKEVLQAAADERSAYADGHSPLQGSGPLDVSVPPNPEIDHPYIEHYFAAHSPFRLLPENLEALDKILALDNATTRIILVEMPVTDTFHTFFGNGEQDYRMFIDTLSTKAAAANISFWRMDDLQTLPYPTWFNYNHLNSDGAPIFSRWLGTILGQDRVSGGR